MVTLALSTAGTTLPVIGDTALTAGTINISNTATLATGTFTQTGGTFLESNGLLNVTGLASLTGSITDKISGGVFKAGALTLGNGATAETLTLAGGALAVGGATTINNLGTLRGSGTITGGAISGTGTITASGGTLDIANTIISGPTLTITSGANSDLKLDGIVTSAAPITINAAVQTLEIGAAGTLTILGTGQDVTGGKILLDGGTLIDASGISFGNANGQNGFLSGFGVVKADLTRLGTSPSTITASGGTLDLTGTFDSGFNAVIDATKVSDLKFDNIVTLARAITMSNANQTLEIGAGGAVTINVAQAVNPGTIKMDGGTLADTGGISFGNGGGLTGSGKVAANLTGGSTDNITASGGTLDLTGTFGSGLVAAIDATKPSDLKFDNTGKLSAPIAITSSNQTLEVGSAGNLTINGAQSVSGGGTIKLDGGTLTKTPTASPSAVAEP